MKTQLRGLMLALFFLVMTSMAHADDGCCILFKNSPSDSPRCDFNIGASRIDNKVACEDSFQGQWVTANSTNNLNTIQECSEYEECLAGCCITKDAVTDSTYCYQSSQIIGVPLMTLAECAAGISERPRYAFIQEPYGTGFACPDEQICDLPTCSGVDIHVEDEFGNSINSAKITVVETTKYTNSVGNATFELPSGNHSITVELPPIYETNSTVSANIPLICSGAESADIVLTRSSFDGKIYGWVRNIADNVPIENLDVVVTFDYDSQTGIPINQQGQNGTSDSDGYFEIMVPDSSIFYNLVINSVPNITFSESQVADIELVNGQKSVGVIYLTKKVLSNMTVVVYDADTNAPLDNVIVGAYGLSNITVLSTNGTSGAYRGEVPRGTGYSVAVSKHQYVTEYLEIDVLNDVHIIVYLSKETSVEEERCDAGDDFWGQVLENSACDDNPCAETFHCNNGACIYYNVSQTGDTNACYGEFTCQAGVCTAETGCTETSHNNGCSYSTDSSCEGGVWQSWDLSNLVQKATYCSKCSEDMNCTFCTEAQYTDNCDYSSNIACDYVTGDTTSYVLSDADQKSAYCSECPGDGDCVETCSGSGLFCCDPNEMTTDGHATALDDTCLANEGCYASCVSSCTNRCDFEYQCDLNYGSLIDYSDDSTCCDTTCADVLTCPVEVNVSDSLNSLDSLYQQASIDTCSCNGEFVSYESSLVASYHFDKLIRYGETDNFVSDYSGNEYHLGRSGGSTVSFLGTLGRYQTGVYKFTGPGYFETSLAGETIRSIEFWVKPFDYSNEPTLFSLSEELKIQDDGKLLFKGFESSTVLTTDVWHHVVVIDNPGYVTLYVDGKNQGTNFSTVPSTTNLRIGHASKNFSGYIDEFNIYSRELTQEEVRKAYSSDVAKILTVNGSCCIGGFNLTCPPRGILNGTILNASGGPAANAKVEILNDIERRQNFTDENGTYWINDVIIGNDYQVYASYPQPSPTQNGNVSGISILDSAITTADISLNVMQQANAQLIINVIDQHGDPVPGVAIFIHYDNDFQENQTTNVTGLTSFENLRTPTSRTIVASKFGYETQTKTVTMIDAAAVGFVYNVQVDLVEKKYYTIDGYVKSNKTGEVLPDSEVVFVDSAFGFLIETTTNNDGYYSQRLPEGTYTITADKVAYKSSTILEFALTQDEEINFSLVEGACFLTKEAPVIKSIKQTTGVVELTINWQNECDEYGFYVYRCRGTLNWTPLSNGSDNMVVLPCNDFEPVSELLPAGTNTYTDSLDMSSDAVYFYNISAVYDYPFVEARFSDIATSAVPGYHACFPHYVEDGIDNYYDEFCEGNTRYKCDPLTNWRILEENCSSYGDFQCLGANKKDPFYFTTKCEHKSACLNATLPYGMFSLYDRDGVFYNTTYGVSFSLYPMNPSVPFCKYDYSDTTVDMFTTVEETKSCYNYRSKMACEESNAINEDCEWIESDYAQLGLGVCRPKDPQHQDCSLCNKDETLFNSIFDMCTKDRCELFGDNTCYYDIRGNEFECRNKKDMGCQDYDTQLDCTGGTDVSVKRLDYNQILESSNDKFGYGLCEWINSTCIKNSNDLYDLGIYEGADCLPSDFACLKDMVTPYTIFPYLKAYNKININQAVYDGQSATSYFSMAPASVSYDDSCWPTTEGAIIQDNGITTCPVPAQLLSNGQDDGNLDVYYFSEDKGHNLEIVRNFTIEYDTISPNVNIELSRDGYEESGSYFTNLTIILNITNKEDWVLCNTTLTSSGAVIAPENNINYSIEDIREWKEESHNIFWIRSYKSLADGQYSFNYKCEDKVHNVNQGALSIVLDADTRISGLEPQWTVNSSFVTLKATTENPAECRWTEKNYSVQKVGDEYKICDNASCYDFETIDATHKLDSVDGLSHSQIRNFGTTNQSYKFYVKCKLTQSLNIAGNDGDIILFTVDTQVPNTGLYSGSYSDVGYSYRNYPLSFSSWSNGETLKVGCLDPVIEDIVGNVDYSSSQLGEYGCGEIYYCEGMGCTPQGTSNMSDYGVDSKGVARYLKELTQPLDVCYYSSDVGGNTETKKCSLARIENNPPTIRNIDSIVISNESTYSMAFDIRNYVYDVDFLSLLQEVNLSFSNVTLEGKVFVDESLFDAEVLSYLVSATSEYRLFVYKEASDKSRIAVLDKNDQQLVTSEVFDVDMFGETNNLSVIVQDPNIIHVLMMAHYDNVGNVDADYCSSGSCSVTNNGVTTAPGRYDNGAFVGYTDTLTYNLTSAVGGNLVSASEGTMSFWFSPNWNGNDGVTHQFLDFSGSTLNDFTIQKLDDGRIEWIPDGVIALYYNISNIVEKSNWYQISASWNSTGTYLFFDGNLVDTNIASVNVADNKLLIIRNSSSIIDELIVTDDSEDYSLTKESPVRDTRTTVKVNGKTVIRYNDIERVGSVVLKGNDNVRFTDFGIADQRLMSPVVYGNISVMNQIENKTFLILNQNESFVYSKTYSKTINLTKASTGNEITISAIDAAGNKMERTITVYVDETGPVVGSSLITNSLSDEIQNSETLFSEYGSDVGFSFSLDDVVYTKITGQSNKANITLAYSGYNSSLLLWCPFDRTSTCGKGTTEVSGGTGFNYVQNDILYGIYVKDNETLSYSASGLFDSTDGTIVLDMIVEDPTKNVIDVNNTRKEIVFEANRFTDVFSIAIDSDHFVNVTLYNISLKLNESPKYNMWYRLTLKWWNGYVDFTMDSLRDVNGSINTSTQVMNGTSWANELYFGSELKLRPDSNGTTFPLIIDDFKVFNKNIPAVMENINLDSLSSNSDGTSFSGTKDNTTVATGIFDIYEIEKGEYLAQFLGFDKFTNSEAEYNLFTVSDTVAPTMSIQFVCNPVDVNYAECQKGILVRNTAVAARYEVVLESSKPLMNDMFNFTYTFDNETDYIEFQKIDLLANKIFVPAMNEFKFNRFVGNLTIASTGKYDNLDDVLAVFTGQVVDYHNVIGTQITTGRTNFTIDTAGPGKPTIIYPEADNTSIVYVKTGEINITGFAPESKAGHDILTMLSNYSLEFANNIPSSDPRIKNYTNSISASSPQTIEWDSATLIVEGIRDNDYVILDGPHRDAFVPGSYVSFVGYPRADQSFYMLDNHSNEAYARISLIPPLESNIPQGTVVNVHLNSKPQGWFSSNLNVSGKLDQAVNKEFYLYSFAVDNHLIRSTEYGYRVIRVDETAPTIESLYPLNNSIEIVQETQINFTVKDLISGLGDAKMVISQQQDGVAEKTYTYFLEDMRWNAIENETGMFLVVLADKEPFVGGLLPYGSYKIDLTVWDKAGWSVTALNWSFRRTTSVPADPEYTIPGAYEVDSVLYIGRKMCFNTSNESFTTRECNYNSTCPTGTTCTNNGYDRAVESPMMNLTASVEFSIFEKVRIIDKDGVPGDNETDVNLLLGYHPAGYTVNGSRRSGIEYVFDFNLLNIEDKDNLLTRRVTGAELMYMEAYKCFETDAGGNCITWGNSQGFTKQYAMPFVVDMRKPHINTEPTWYANSLTKEITGKVIDFNVDENGGNITVCQKDYFSSIPVCELGNVTAATENNVYVKERDWKKTISLVPGIAREINLTVIACDKAGNCNSNLSILRFDDGAPIVSDNYMVSGTWVNYTNDAVFAAVDVFSEIESFESCLGVGCSDYSTVGFWLDNTSIDYNSDGKVNDSDRIYLINITQGVYSCLSSQICDFDNNGVINSNDVSAYNNHILGASTDASYALSRYLISEDTNTYLRTRAKDRAGNPSNVLDINILIDMTPPVTVLAGQSEEFSSGVWYDQPITLELTSDCDISGCISTKYLTYENASGFNSDYNTWTNYVGGITITKQGITNITYASKDNASNTENFTTVVYKLDTESPEFTIETATTPLGTFDLVAGQTWITAYSTATIAGIWTDNMQNFGSNISLTVQENPSLVASITQGGIINVVDTFSDGTSSKIVEFNESETKSFSIRVPKGAYISSAAIAFENLTFDQNQPGNVSIGLPGSGYIYTSSGSHVTKSTTMNFANMLQPLLVNCTAVGTYYCDIAFNISSNQTSRIELSDVDIRFELLDGLNPKEAATSLQWASVDSKIKTINVTSTGQIINATLKVTGNDIDGAYLSNVNISIGDVSIWNNSGTFNSAVIINFANILQQHRDASCSPSQRYCEIDLKFETDSIGELLITELTVESSNVALNNINTFSIELPFSPGFNNFTLVALDNAGNNASQKLVVYMDEFGPEVDIILPITQYVDLVDVVVQVNTSEDSVCFIEPDTNDGMTLLVPMQNVTGNVLHEYTYYLFSKPTNYSISCRDLYGNWANDVESEILIDRDKPKFADGYPTVVPDPVIEMPIIVTLQRNIIEEGSGDLEPAYCSYYFVNNNNGINMTVTEAATNFTSGPWNTTVRFDDVGGLTPALSNGNWTVNTTCYDRAAHAVSASINFTVAVDAPLTVQIVVPNNGDVLSGVFEVNVITDKVTDFCSYSYKDGVDTITSSLNRTSTTFGFGDVYQQNATILTEGNTTLNVSCNALDGKTNSSTINLTIDRSAPGVEIVGLWSSYETQVVTQTTTFVDLASEKTFDFDSSSNLVSYDFEYLIPLGSKLSVAKLDYSRLFTSQPGVTPTFNLIGVGAVSNSDFKTELQSVVSDCQAIENNSCRIKMNITYNAIARVTISNLELTYTVEDALIQSGDARKEFYFVDTTVNQTYTFEVSPYAYIINANMTFVNLSIAGVSPENVTLQFNNSNSLMPIDFANQSLNITNEIVNYIGLSCNVSQGYLQETCSVVVNVHSDSIGQVNIEKITISTTRDLFSAGQVDDKYMNITGDSILLETDEVIANTHAFVINLTMNDTYSNITRFEYALVSQETNTSLGESSFVYTSGLVNTPTPVIYSNINENTIEFKNIPDGKYDLYVRTFDSFGQNDSTTKTIYVDTVDPVVTIISPIAGSFHNTRQHDFNISVKDAFGVENVYMTYDDCNFDLTECNTELQIEDGLMNNDSTSLAVGKKYFKSLRINPDSDDRKYRVRFIVNESVQGKNASIVSEMIMTYDNNAPDVFDLDRPLDSAYFTDSTFNWSVASDLNLKEYLIYVNNTNTGELLVKSAGTSNFYGFEVGTFSGQAKYEWWVVAYDQAGNTRTSTSTHINYYDNQPPVIDSISEPQSNQYQTSTLVSVIGFTEPNVTVTVVVVDQYGLNISTNSTITAVTNSSSGFKATIANKDIVADQSNSIHLNGDWSDKDEHKLFFTNDPKNAYEITNDPIRGTKTEETLSLVANGQLTGYTKTMNMGITLLYQDGSYNAINNFTGVVDAQIINGTILNGNRLEINASDYFIFREVGSSILEIQSGFFNGSSVNASNLTIITRNTQNRTSADYVSSPYYVKLTETLGYTIVMLSKAVEKNAAVGETVTIFEPNTNISGMFDMYVHIAENQSNSLIITAFDAAGNSDSALIENLVVDSQAPTFGRVSPPINGYTTNNENLSIEIDIFEQPTSQYASGIEPSKIVFQLDGVTIDSGNYSITGTNPILKFKYNTAIPYAEILHTAVLSVEDRSGNTNSISSQFTISKNMPSYMREQVPNIILNETAAGVITYYVDSSNVDKVNLTFFMDNAFSTLDSQVEIANVTINDAYVDSSAWTGSNGDYVLTMPAGLFTTSKSAELSVFGRTLLDNVEMVYSEVKEFKFKIVLDYTSPVIQDILFDYATSLDRLYTKNRQIRFRVEFEETNPYYLFVNETTLGNYYNYSIADSTGGFTNEFVYPKDIYYAADGSQDGEKTIIVSMIDYVSKVSNVYNESIVLDSIVPLMNVLGVSSHDPEKSVIISGNDYLTGSNNVDITFNYSDTNMRYVGLKSSGSLLLGSTSPLQISEMQTTGDNNGLKAFVANTYPISIFSGSDKGESGVLLGTLSPSGNFSGTLKSNFGNARIYILNENPSSYYQIPSQTIIASTDKGTFPIFINSYSIPPSKALSLYVADDGSTFYAYKDETGLGEPDLNATEAMVYEYSHATPNKELSESDFDGYKDIVLNNGTEIMNISLVKGMNEIVIYAYDKAGNYNSSLIRVDYDYSPPNITLISSNLTTDMFPTITVETDEFNANCFFNPTRGSETRFVMTSIGGGKIHSYTYQDYFSLDENFQYEYNIKCVDTMGNEGGYNGTFIIDRTPPSLDFNFKDYVNYEEPDTVGNYFKIVDRHEGLIQALVEVVDISDSINKNINCTYECLGEYCDYVHNPNGNKMGDGSFEISPEAHFIYPYINDEYDYVVSCKDLAGNFGKGRLTLGVDLAVQYRITSPLENKILNYTNVNISIATNLATSNCEIRQTEPVLFPEYSNMTGFDTRFNILRTLVDNTDYKYEIDCDPINKFEYDSYKYYLEFSINTSYVEPLVVSFAETNLTIIAPWLEITQDTTPTIGFNVNGSITNCTTVEYADAYGITHSVKQISDVTNYIVGAKECASSSDCNTGQTCNIVSAPGRCIYSGVQELGFADVYSTDLNYDYNFDGVVDSVDLVLIQNYVGNKSVCDGRQCDIDQNSIVDSNDVTILQRFIDQGVNECESIANCNVTDGQTCVEPTTPAMFCGYSELNLVYGFPERFDSANVSFDYDGSGVGQSDLVQLSTYVNQTQTCGIKLCNVNSSDNQIDITDVTLHSDYINQGLVDCTNNASICSLYGTTYSCQAPITFNTTYCISSILNLTHGFPERFDNNLLYDVNNDSSVNDTDVLYLVEVSLGFESCTVNKTCDMDNNSIVNSADVTLLRNYLTQGLTKCTLDSQCQFDQTCEVPTEYVTDYCISPQLVSLGYPEQYTYNVSFDFDADSDVDATDTSYISSFIANNVTCRTKDCDLNDDLTINETDVNLLAKFIDNGVFECVSNATCNTANGQDCIQPAQNATYCIYQDLVGLYSLPQRYTYNSNYDFNADGIINQTDVVLLDAVTQGFTCEFKDCDMDDDGAVSVIDSSLFEMYLDHGIDTCLENRDCSDDQICSQESEVRNYCGDVNHTYSFDVNYPLNENGITSFNFSCHENGVLRELEKEIEVDTRAPAIMKLRSETGYLYDGQKNEYVIIKGEKNQTTTRLIVEANEEVFCRYDTNLNHEQYADMDNEFHTVSDVYKHKYLSYTDNLYYNDTKGVREEQHYVSCVDRAGNVARSFKDITITVDLDKNVHIFNITPVKDNQFINTRETTIAFNTLEESECFIDKGLSQDTFWDKFIDFLEPPIKLESENYTEYYRYEYTIEDLTDAYGDPVEYKGYKHYGFEITCEDKNEIFFEDSFEKSFKVDITPSEIEIISPAVVEGSKYKVSKSNVSLAFNIEKQAQIARIFVNELLQQEFVNGSNGYNIDNGSVTGSLYLKNGTNDITIEVIDKANNNVTKDFEIVFNNSGPFIRRVIPDQGIFRGSAVFGNLIVADLEKNINTINYSRSTIELRNLSGAIIPITKTANTDRLEYIIGTNLPDGTYSIIVVAYDNQSIGEVGFKRFTIHENASLINVYNNKTTEKLEMDNEIITQPENTLVIEVTPDSVDEENPIETVQFVLNNQKTDLAPDRTNEIIIDLKEGLNTYYIYTNTTLGYEGKTYLYHTWLDTEAPVAEICVGVACGADTAAIKSRLIANLQATSSQVKTTSSVIIPG